MDVLSEEYFKGNESYLIKMQVDKKEWHRINAILENSIVGMEMTLWNLKWM